MHYKQNNKETRRYVQGLRPFVNTLPRQLKGVLKKKGYNYSEIINKWNIFAGNEASKYSIPKSIKTTINSSKKTLVVAVERGNEIVLEYSKEDIIKRVNSYFGYELINDIKLLNINLNNKKKNVKNSIKFSKKLNEKIDMIKNKEIKKSLSNLLKAINND